MANFSFPNRGGNLDLMQVEFRPFLTMYHNIKIIESGVRLFNKNNPDSYTDITGIDLSFQKSGSSDFQRFLSGYIHEINIYVNGTPITSTSGLKIHADTFNFAAQKGNGSFGANLIFKGDDNITLTNYNDRVNSRNGNDVVFGLDGDDIIYGDTSHFSYGNDLLIGGSGKDTLIGYGGNDRLLGGTGKDQLFGGSGKDVYVGGSGADTFHFENFNGQKGYRGRLIIEDFDAHGVDHDYINIENCDLSRDNWQTIKHHSWVKDGSLLISFQSDQKRDAYSIAEIEHISKADLSFDLFVWN